MSRKPLLAEDAIIEQVAFPCIVQPKIDGVRAMNLGGMLTGRSLDPFEGLGITDYFSKPEFLGFDGEMTLGDIPNCTDRLCHRTSGAMGRFKGVEEMADLHWWVFDYITDDTHSRAYVERYRWAREKVHDLNHPRLHIVPSHTANDDAELQHLIGAFFDKGYEGAIIRNPDAPHKEGRATKKLQHLWRVKPWADSEMLVTGITEGERNENEAKTNTLGRTERSSAKSGMVPNGQVGSIQGTLLEDIRHPFTGDLLFPKGLQVTIGSGEMTVKEATDYWQNPDKIVGHVVKFKHMVHGVKDLPRMATYRSHRLAQDMS